MPPASRPECDPNHLLALARAGDWDAVEQASRCFGERLLAVGRSQCRTEAEAEDAVQEALLTAGLHLEQFRGEGSIDGWLMRMVVTACRRMQRGRKNDPSLHVVDTELRTSAKDPEREASEHQLATTLTQALSVLSPQERLLLLLAEGEGRSAPELARQLEASPAAIRKRLQRAREKMRAALEPSLEQWLWE